MSCCTRTLPLGCYDKCDVIELPFEYEQDGIHTHEYEVSYTRNKQKFDVDIGDPVRIDASLLNEQAEHILQIRQPDGTYFKFVKDDIEYDCVSFNTQI